MGLVVGDVEFSSVCESWDGIDVGSSARALDFFLLLRCFVEPGTD